jgi:hypothetical protein
MFTVIGIMVIGVTVVAGLIWHERKACHVRHDRTETPSPQPSHESDR